MNARLQETWENYTATWKMTDRAARMAAFADVLAEGAVYTDPLMRAGSWDELIDYMEQFHQQVPGGHFVTTGFASHHQKSLARWDMKSGDGATIGKGASYGEYDAEGKLLSMNGFFEANA